jgi:hypothetical protein
MSNFTKEEKCFFIIKAVFAKHSLNVFFVPLFLDKGVFGKHALLFSFSTNFSPVLLNKTPNDFQKF